MFANQANAQSAKIELSIESIRYKIRGQGPVDDGGCFGTAWDEPGHIEMSLNTGITVNNQTHTFFIASSPVQNCCYTYTEDSTYLISMPPVIIDNATLVNFNVEVWEDDRGNRNSFDCCGTWTNDDDCHAYLTGTIESPRHRSRYFSYQNRDYCLDSDTAIMIRFVNDNSLDGLTIEGWVNLTWRFIEDASVNSLQPTCVNQTASYSSHANPSWPIDLRANDRYWFSYTNVDGNSWQTDLKLIDTDGISCLASQGDRSGFFFTAQRSGTYFLAVRNIFSTPEGAITYRNASPDVQISLTTTPASLSGSEGTMTANLSSWPDDGFRWSAGRTPFGVPANRREELSAGNHCLTVTDNGCEYSACAVVQSDPCYYPILAEFDVENTTSAGGTDGSIVVQPINSNHSQSASTYHFQWSNGDSTASISNLSEGTYYVLITDAYGCEMQGRTYLTDPFEYDGPMNVQVRVAQVYVRDFDVADAGGNVEHTWLVYCRDHLNEDGLDWLDPVCIDLSLGSSDFIAHNLPGDGHVSAALNRSIYNTNFGAETPQFFQVKMDAWEDDCGDICEFNSSCNFGLLEDDAHCQQSIAVDFPFRLAGPQGEWNDHGWHTTCNGMYGLRLESRWEQVIPANASQDGPISLQVRADMLHALNDNENAFQGDAETVWVLGVNDDADLDGQTTVENCIQRTIPQASFPYTLNSNIPLSSHSYPIWVPTAYRVNLEAWEDDTGDPCEFDPGTITNDDAYCFSSGVAINFRSNPPGVWTMDETRYPCASEYGMSYSSLWGFEKGEEPNAPIVLGSSSCGPEVFEHYNNTAGYSNSVGSNIASKEVYYQIELKEPAKLMASTCSPRTEFDTHLLLTDNLGNIILSNDNWPSCSDSLASEINSNALADSVIASGVYFIVVESGNSDQGLFELSVSITPVPRAQILGLPDLVCSDERPLQINASPRGGTFSGAGMQTNVLTVDTILVTDSLNGISTEYDTSFIDLFSPGLSQTGWDTVHYTTTTVNGCPVSAKQAVFISPLPDATFTGLPDSLCLKADTLSLTPTEPGGYFTGIADSNGQLPLNTNDFDTSVVTYFITDTNGCSNSSSKSILIYKEEADSVAVHCFGDSINVSGEFITEPQVSQHLFIPNSGTCATFYTTQHLFSLPQPQTVSTEPAITGADGTIFIRGISGGTAPYLIEWSSGDTANFISNLTAGTYQVTITDASGCSSTLSLTVPQARPQLMLKAFLGGNYIDSLGLMSDALRRDSSFPFQEPYSTIFSHAGQGGIETIDSAMLVESGYNSLVDWIFVELRDKHDSTKVLATRSALLQRDGDIADIDGDGLLSFDSIQIDSYYVAIRHRNHLGVMTADPISLGTEPVIIDFTDPNTQVYGQNAMQSINGKTLLWCGNVIADGYLRYSGIHNDRDPILVRIGGQVPTNVVTGYWLEDVNLDGEVKFSGQNNDRDIILQNIGGNVPTAILFEQLPR